MDIKLPLIDIVAYAAGLSKKIDKDVRRARLFLVACTNKQAELLRTDPQRAALFAASAVALTGEWFEVLLKLNPSKLSLGGILRLLGRDVTVDLRQETREFAHYWSLDPVLIEALG